MKKFVFLLTLLAAGSHVNAAIMYFAALNCDTPACITGSVTAQVSWQLEVPVVSVEVDDNLGNFLFGLTGPLSPTPVGSIFPTEQTVSGLDLNEINLLTSTVGLTTTSLNSITTSATASFANVVLRTSAGGISDSTRFTAVRAVGNAVTPEPATWSFIAAGIGVMVLARARRTADPAHPPGEQNRER